MQEYLPYLNWINDQQQKMIEQVVAWSSINSGSFNTEGVEAMAKTAAAAFASLGGEVEWRALPPMHNINSRGELEPVALGPLVMIRKRPSAPFKVLLTGHLDTVFGKSSAFQTPRWLDANTLNGPGVADMKGGIVIFLTALQALERSPWASQIGWTVILNPDEEIGSPGSTPVLIEAAREHHIGLVYEPAMTPEGALSGQRKGSVNYSLVVHGRAAHAGRDFAAGRSAIVALAEAIRQLHQLNGQREGLTLNIGQVEGGEALNVVPELAIGHFNARVHCGEDFAWLDAKLEQIVAHLDSQDGIRAELHKTTVRAPKPLVGRTLQLFEWVKETAAQLALDIRWKESGGVCDGNTLAGAGLPNVDSLGVRGGKIHSDQEYVLVDSLSERARLTALLLMRAAREGYFAQCAK